MGAKAKRNDMQKESLSKVEQTLGDIGRDVTRFERSAPPRHKIGLALPSLVSKYKSGERKLYVPELREVWDRSKQRSGRHEWRPGLSNCGLKP